MKVYLIGHIPKNDDHDWRKDLIQEWAMSVTDSDIEFLVPENTSNDHLYEMRHEITSTRDMMYLNTCDVAIAYLNLDAGKFLGGSWELGYLFAIRKPVILWNHHPNMPRTKFLEHHASVVVYDMAQVLETLKYMEKHIC
jgi:nucleoside 2-deoxyribosyltransferase